MVHGSTDPAIRLCTKNSVMGMMDHLAGATINLLGQPGNPVFLREKMWVKI